MKLKKIDIGSIKGFKLGNAENASAGTGCTVIICEEGALGGVDVRGGAPATRETDLLASENTVERVNAVVLSGGSAFGLEASCGVMKVLSDKGIGFRISDVSVPVVCGASLFDLNVGSAASYPDIEMGAEAAVNAYEGVFDSGNHGAGTGATVGKLLGMDRSMKAGLGTFACSDGIVDVGAVVAVNACADIYNGAGNIVAGLRTEDGESICGTIKVLKQMLRPETEAESLFSEFNKQNDRFSLKKDNVLPQSVNTNEKSIIAKAIAEAYDRSSDTGKTSETSTEKSDSEADVSVCESEEAGNPVSDAETDNVYLSPDEMTEDIKDDMGYSISFNTTISCLITNAVLTKSEANKLASILHDAYARAIKPVHSTLDGDTVFVLSRCTQKVNFDAFAALATDVMQYAIIDGAMSAEGAYGLPASKDLVNR